MKEYILETKDLEYTYGDGTHALKGVNLKIEKGKKIVVVGVNGSGKSTLFLNLNGVLRATKGEIYFKGEKLEYNKKALMKIREKIGIVFQNPETMLFSSNVFQEVSFGAINLGLDEKIVRSRVEQALKDVHMEDYAEKSIHFLSYGQKKRVSIADIIVMKPELIIFDEPTSSLDPKHSKQVIDIFDSLSKNDITIIVSTHDINFAYSWADYVIVMKDGLIRKEGRPEEVFSDTALMEECYLEKPYILEFFEQLKDKKAIKGEKIPKTKEELYMMIE